MRPRRAGLISLAVVLVLAGCATAADRTPDRVAGDGAHDGAIRASRARRPLAGPLPGRLFVARLLTCDCRGGPNGWYDRWTAGPAWRFRRAGTHRTATPIPPRISPDGRWLLF